MRAVVLLVWAVMAGLALSLQTCLAPAIEIRGVRPDFVLAFAVFFALHAPAVDAILVIWFVGLLADSLTVERPGLLALSYGLSAALVVAIRPYLFARRALTQFVLTLVLAIVLRTVWFGYRQAMYSLEESAAAAFADVVVGSIYTALLAALLHRLLIGLAQPLGLSQAPALPPSVSAQKAGIRV